MFVPPQLSNDVKEARVVLFSFQLRKQRSREFRGLDQGHRASISMGSLRHFTDKYMNFAENSTE